MDGACVFRQRMLELTSEEDERFLPRCMKKKTFHLSTRWAPTSYEWSCNPYRWPKIMSNWGYFTPINEVD